MRIFLPQFSPISGIGTFDLTCSSSIARPMDAFVPPSADLRLSGLCFFAAPVDKAPRQLRKKMGSDGFEKIARMNGMALEIKIDEGCRRTGARVRVRLGGYNMGSVKIKIGRGRQVRMTMNCLRNELGTGLPVRSAGIARAIKEHFIRADLALSPRLAPDAQRKNRAFGPR